MTQQNGFQVTVYDKEQHIGGRTWKWTMVVHWGLPTLRDMLPAEVFYALKYAHANPFYAYSDDKPETATIKGGMCTGIGYTLGKKVTDIRVEDSKEEETGRPGPVTIAFEGGEVATADLMIGADGSSSRVRRWLVGEEAGKSLLSEYMIGSGIVKYGTAEQAKKLLEPSELCAVATGPTANNVVDPEDKTTYSFQVVRIWHGTEEGRDGKEAIARMKEVTASDMFQEPFYSAIHAIPQASDPIFTRQLTYWPTVSWDNRRGSVTLAGDAVHSMLPNRGRGLNHALADVMQLVKQLVRVKVKGISVQEALEFMTNKKLSESTQAKRGLAR
ncbi:hypothetical protein B0H63DRAFT_559452 [Podospora didyma]|uniref:FAD-binding domain-containing protein n=1 Tax=Podospora didyma TaxID=330526 RepID=A0AAE0U2C3_9PEZI|nr:hypothetical protein B0H63DRAFT_559452 [Podospora didyma]